MKAIYVLLLSISFSSILFSMQLTTGDPSTLPTTLPTITPLPTISLSTWQQCKNFVRKNKRGGIAVGTITLIAAAGFACDTGSLITDPEENDQRFYFFLGSIVSRSAVISALSLWKIIK